MNVAFISITAAFIIALVVIFVLIRYYSGKRAEALRQLAQTMNFTFSPKGDATLLAALSGFHLFSQGQSRKYSNVLSGKYHGISIMILDYQYTTGGGEDAHTWRQTVLAIESDKLLLPNFVLRPEGLFDKIGNVFGYKDIDYELYPKFSKQYFLRGKNTQSVRNIFSDSTIQYYEQHPGLSTEGEGNRFICYNGSKVVSVDQIQNFMQQGYELFELFKN